MPDLKTELSKIISIKQSGRNINIASKDKGKAMYLAAKQVKGKLQIIAYKFNPRSHKEDNPSAILSEIKLEKGAKLNINCSDKNDAIYCQKSGCETKIYGNGGDDFIAGSRDKFNTIYGDNGKDTKDGGDDILIGGNNGNYLCGEGGDDDMQGGSTKNFLQNKTPADWIIGGKGYDKIQTGLSPFYVDGGDGNDTIKATNFGAFRTTRSRFRGYILGGAGNDHISISDSHFSIPGISSTEMKEVPTKVAGAKIIIAPNYLDKVKPESTEQNTISIDIQNNTGSTNELLNIEHGENRIIANSKDLIIKPGKGVFKNGYWFKGHANLIHANYSLKLITTNFDKEIKRAYALKAQERHDVNNLLAIGGSGIPKKSSVQREKTKAKKVLGKKRKTVNTSRTDKKHLKQRKFSHVEIHSKLAKKMNAEIETSRNNIAEESKDEDLRDLMAPSLQTHIEKFGFIDSEVKFANGKANALVQAKIKEAIEQYGQHKDLSKLFETCMFANSDLQLSLNKEDKAEANKKILALYNKAANDAQKVFKETGKLDDFIQIFETVNKFKRAASYYLNSYVNATNFFIKKPLETKINKLVQENQFFDVNKEAEIEKLLKLHEKASPKAKSYRAKIKKAVEASKTEKVG